MYSHLNLNSGIIILKIGVVFYFQKLYLDRHLPYKEGQLFLFASPITATVVRIRPVSKIDIAGMLCLRLELIGCPLVGKNFNSLLFL